MTTKPHDALSLPLSERVDYLTVVASMAGADVVLEPEETARLRTLCTELGLPENETEKVLEASHRATAKIERHLEALTSSSLRFALLSDCISLAYADGDYGQEERDEVTSLAGSLGVNDEQLAAIEQCVRTVREVAEKEGGGDHEKIGAEIAEKLAAVGVPVGIVGTAAAVSLEIAGVSSGLAALGLGLGIASGFGAALGLGVGTYMGVRWLKDKLAQ